MPFKYVDELDTEYHLTTLATIARDHQAINAAEFDALMRCVDVMLRRDRRGAWLAYCSDQIGAFIHWKIQAALWAVLFPLAFFVPVAFASITACGILVFLFSLVSLLAVIRSHQIKRRVMNESLAMIKVVTDKLPENREIVGAIVELTNQLKARREARS